MDIIEELKKEPISSNYFNLLGSLTNYSGLAFQMKGILDLTIQKLKMAYPNLSDRECSAICHPFFMTGEDYQIHDFIIVEDTVLEFINKNNYFLYSDYIRICKLDKEKKVYRTIISEDFFYNLRGSYYKNGRIINQNDTGLSLKEKIKYSKFFGYALNSFLDVQGININVLPNLEQMKDNGDSRLFLYKDLSYICQDYSIFINCNFPNLVCSFAKKEDFSTNILIFKGKQLAIAATLSQTFDQWNDCQILLKSIELPYFSLNNGYQKTTVENNIENISFYSQFSNKKGSQNFKIKGANKSDSTTLVKNQFPYNAILIDSGKKGSLIEAFPLLVHLPILEIPSFNSLSEMFAFFREIIQNYQTENQSPLLISDNPTLITAYHLFNLDTCFINSRFNDTESYQTTYEVSCLEKIKKIHLKTTR